MPHAATPSFDPVPESDTRAALQVALRASNDGASIVRHLAPDDAFFYLGDTAWELFHKLDMVQAERYLRNRADKGFNVVMAVILAESRGLSTPNKQGDLPLFHTPAESTLPADADPTKPNPAYFRHVDKIVALASSLGLAVALVPTWGSYINGGIGSGPLIFNESNAYSYGAFLGKRYPFQMYIVGGDTNRYWNPDVHKTVMAGSDVRELEIIDYGLIIDAMARGIHAGYKTATEGFSPELRSLAGDYTPFMTHHSTQGWLPGGPPSIASSQFPDADWLSFDCVQTGHCDVHPAPHFSDDWMWQGSSVYQPMRIMYERSRTQAASGRRAARPVMDLEGHYEATHHAFTRSNPIWNADDIRAGAWQGIFAGGAGYTYGCNSIWQMYDASEPVDPNLPSGNAYTSWHLELDLPGAWHVGVMRRILSSLPRWSRRVPDSLFIISPTNEPRADAIKPDGTRLLAGDKLIQGLIAPPSAPAAADAWALVHLPWGGSVLVDTTKALGLGSSWRAWWLDTKCGAKVYVRDGSGGDKETFRSPTEGSIREDWILYLEQQS